MMKKFYLERKGTVIVKRLEIQDDKDVYDLLQEAITLFDFDEDTVLSVHYEDDDSLIREEVSLSELDDKKRFIIEVQKQSKNEVERNKNRDEENMKKAEKAMESVSKHLGGEPSRDKGFDERFAQQKPQQQSRSSEQHMTFLRDLQGRTSTGSHAMPGSANEAGELVILNQKMDLDGMDGFQYTVVPKEYGHHNESSYVEHSFSSEQERQATHSKVGTTSDWSSWNVNAGFSGWGVSVSAGGGQDHSSSQSEGVKTEQLKKAKVAIVTTTCFHHMKSFRVNVRLNPEAVRDAKAILNADMPSRKEAIETFKQKYCSYVYSGRFRAGGWFRTIATATSDEAMDFKALAQAATAKTKSHSEIGASGWGAEASAGGRQGTRSSTDTQQSHQNTSSMVQVTIKKESAPGNTCNEKDLEQKVKDARNWIVSPVNEAKKVDFVPVYEIMEAQAKEENDKDLLIAATTIRKHLKATEDERKRQLVESKKLADERQAMEERLKKLNSEIETMKKDRRSMADGSTRGGIGKLSSKEDCGILWKAAVKGNLAEVQKCLGTNMNQLMDLEGRTQEAAIHVAAKEGHVSVVQELVQRGAIVDLRDEDDVTVLHGAARGGHLEVMKYLVTNGADINARDKDDATVLHAAAEEGRLEVVKYLVANGADINARDKDDWTALRQAAVGRHLEVVKYLVTNGADIDARDKNDWTALHRAAWEGRLEVVKSLVTIGADINARDKKGRRPIDMARESGWSGSEDVVKYLGSLPN